MRDNKFDTVFLFGYSPHFKDLGDACVNADIKCSVFHGSRQTEEVRSLNLNQRVAIACVDTLESAKYRDLMSIAKKPLGISFGSPFIFSEKCIQDFNGSLINSHGAPLPEFKGGGGFSWRILMNDKRGACLMHLVTKEIDGGPVVFRQDFQFSEKHRKPIDRQEEQLRQEKHQMIPWLLSTILSGSIKVKVQQAQPTAQQDASYFPRLSTNINGYIDWRAKIHHLEAHILAFSSPYNEAMTYAKEQLVRILDASIKDHRDWHPLSWGIITEAYENYIEVACNGGTLMVIVDFIKTTKQGYSNISPGERFWTPEHLLEASYATKVVFRPDGLKAIDYRDLV